ncbi:50S ribosomal protein L17 [Haliscomenobacter sp.]|uniref:50S ribosomal protein L17 n=1 Tax=Haliscomenobacter sp. TaxID=2717303 RepID=UPI003BAB8945
MRHGKKHNHLGRKAEHRQALLMNLSIALITHKRITTTLAKAKALRVHLEPLVTKAKDDSTHNRRVVFSYLQNKEAIKELFDVIGPKVGDRPGGYLRVIKIGFRRSDASDMAIIEFVDFNELYNPGAEAKADSKRRRRGRGGKAKTEATPAATTTATEVVETTEETATEAEDKE